MIFASLALFFLPEEANSREVKKVFRAIKVGSFQGIWVPVRGFESLLG